MSRQQIVVQTARWRALARAAALAVAGAALADTAPARWWAASPIPMTLTPCLTSFLGRWGLGDDWSWFVLHQGLDTLTGSFAIYDEEGNAFQADLVGFPIGQRRRTLCVLGTFEGTFPGVEYPVTGTFDLYQIATGKLVCRLLFADGWSLDLILEGPF
jgi:hypothetical protein